MPKKNEEFPVHILSKAQSILINIDILKKILCILP